MENSSGGQTNGTQGNIHFTFFCTEKLVHQALYFLCSFSSMEGSLKRTISGKNFQGG